VTSTVNKFPKSTFIFKSTLGGLLGAKADDMFDDDSSWNCSCVGIGDVEVEREKFFDPNLRKDFLAWKKEPTFERGVSGFLERLYKEDIDLCLVIYICLSLFSLYPSLSLSRSLSLSFFFLSLSLQVRLKL
jgi:hypothetical protein